MAFYRVGLATLVVVVTCVSAQDIVCKQRSKNDRDFVEFFNCFEGCCGNELTYAYCCEMLNPDKMYTQFDHKKGLSPIHYFLIVAGGLLFIAALTSTIFCVIKYSRTDKRTCACL